MIFRIVCAIVVISSLLLLSACSKEQEASSQQMSPENMAVPADAIHRLARPTRAQDKF